MAKTTKKSSAPAEVAREFNREQMFIRIGHIIHVAGLVTAANAHHLLESRRPEPLRVPGDYESKIVVERAIGLATHLVDEIYRRELMGGER